MQHAFYFILLLAVLAAAQAPDSKTPASKADTAAGESGDDLSTEEGAEKSPGSSRPVLAAGVSNVFDLNTQSARDKRMPTSIQGRGVATAFSQRYKLNGPSRVKIQIYMGEKLIRKLADEEQSSGTHYIFWDGLDDAGARVAGEFICKMTYKPAKKKEKTAEYNFQVK